MKIEKVSISTVKANPNNPRVIKDDKFRKLVQSIKDFPEMLEIRPIVVNQDMIVLGGNMRLKACKEAGLKEVPIIHADNLTEEQQREFIIKDNVSGGEWDWELLASEWDTDLLDEWGLDVPVETETETEKLSKLEFQDVYYQPKEEPNVTLSECVDFTKFHAKVKAIEESPLSDEQKEVLKWFAYRFIRINFEQVANYYFFNADDEEQKVMERLRLVLSDSGLQGFIDDDILRAHEYIEDWSND
jgi:hypothetical protein